ncbi:unnamed protein product [Polarella glacialis]|uniref:Uncharacterized protein n=1 Tax=Polarella glacialis TaxID=89957 RepID=A0A813E7K9_POLGL|nr:unnamed protein product [Polarella glacialis]CAE8646923.1 unnamed protein product [Polarella glacialis]
MHSKKRPQACPRLVKEASTAASKKGSLSALRQACATSQGEVRECEAKQADLKKALTAAEAAERRAKQDIQKAKSGLSSVEKELKQKKSAVAVASKAVEEHFRKNPAALLKSSGTGGLSDWPLTRFGPVCYKSRNMHYAEEDGECGGMECEISAVVRAETYQLTNDGKQLHCIEQCTSGAAAAGDGDGVGSGESAAKRRKGNYDSSSDIGKQKRTSRPLVASAAAFTKLKREAEKNGKVVAARGSLVEGAVLSALNFGDDACLGNMLLGSCDHDDLTAAKPRMTFGLGASSEISEEEESLRFLKRKLTQDLGLHQLASEFIARQEQRSCKELAAWYVGDGTKRRGACYSGTSKRRLLLVGTGPAVAASSSSSFSADPCTEAMLIDIKFDFTATQHFDGMDAEDF